MTVHRLPADIMDNLAGQLEADPVAGVPVFDVEWLKCHRCGYVVAGAARGAPWSLAVHAEIRHPADDQRHGLFVLGAGEIIG